MTKYFRCALCSKPIIIHSRAFRQVIRKLMPPAQRYHWRCGKKAAKAQQEQPPIITGDACGALEGME